MAKRKTASKSEDIPQEVEETQSEEKEKETCGSAHKPVVIVKDDRTRRPFDTQNIVDLVYPYDLRYPGVRDFQDLLQEKIRHTAESNYFAFREHFQKYQSPGLETINTTDMKLILNEIKELKDVISSQPRILPANLGGSSLQAIGEEGSQGVRYKRELNRVLIEIPQTTITYADVKELITKIRARFPKVEVNGSADKQSETYEIELRHHFGPRHRSILHSKIRTMVDEAVSE